MLTLLLRRCSVGMFVNLWISNNKPPLSSPQSFMHLNGGTQPTPPQKYSFTLVKDKGKSLHSLSLPPHTSNGAGWWEKQRNEKFVQPCKLWALAMATDRERFNMLKGFTNHFCAVLSGTNESRQIQKRLAKSILNTVSLWFAIINVTIPQADFINNQFTNAHFAFEEMQRWDVRESLNL